MKNLSNLITIITIAGLLIGCKSAPPEKPLPSVTVTSPTEQQVTEWKEFSGRLESPQVANVAARVTGIIVEAPFQEGSFVNEGDLLFVIDDRPFKAELASKEADVVKNQALLTKAELKLKRYQKIKETGAVSIEDLDQATADFKEAESNLASAKAAANIAQLNLEWTMVRAPISGQVSKKLVTEGNNVIGGSGNLTQLTTITSIDPVYAYVSVPENEAGRYNAAGSATPCEYKLETDSGFKTNCTVNFIDSRVTVDTGTVQLRGIIPNTDSRLKPGMFVRVRLPGGDPYKTILIPDIAINADQDSRYVLTVNAEGIVQRKAVKLGAKFDKLRAIEDGISINDRIVIAGLHLSKPGTKVNAIDANTPAA